MTAITKERVEELRKHLGSVLHLAALDGRNDDVGSLVDLLAVLDDYEKMRVENERLNTWHCTLSEAWKARAEKAEAQLAKQVPLVEAAMRARLVKFSNTDIGGYEPHVQRILRAALALREAKEKK